MAIQSFADKATEEFFLVGRVATKVGWSPVRRVVKRKLDMLHYAFKLADLRMPPVNRLEALRGKLKAYHSIRVNDQWRIVFQWTAQGPCCVKVVDYH